MALSTPQPTVALQQSVARVALILFGYDPLKLDEVVLTSNRNELGVLNTTGVCFGRCGWKGNKRRRTGVMVFK